jgi:hypothetical protein
MALPPWLRLHFVQNQIELGTVRAPASWDLGFEPLAWINPIWRCCSADPAKVVWAETNTAAASIKAVRVRRVDGSMSLG